jgi:hypothetical protein
MGRYSPELGSYCRITPHLAASYRTGQKETLLNRRSGISIRNGVLLCKQLIRLTMDYACPICRCAVPNYVKQLQALQSKCLRIPTGAPWYISNTQIQEDLGVPLFEKHTRALTENYDPKLADMGKHLFRQLGRYLH